MKFSFADGRLAQLGGTADWLAMTAMMAGGLASNPALLGTTATGLLAGSCFSAAGGAWLGKRYADNLRVAEVEEEGALVINSSQVPRFDPNGVHIGFVKDTGEELVIPMDEWMRHGLVLGQSGVGKTVLGEWLMFQQIQAGGGLLWLDGKLDPDNIQRLWHMCAWSGRPLDLLVINPGDPSFSNTYSPVLEGDADEVAARAISMIPTAESNAGADFYRQGATVAVTTLVDAIRATNRAFGFTDFRLLLSSEKALNILQSLMPPDSDALHDLKLFLDQFRNAPQGGGPGKLSVEKLRQMFGGLGSRLAQFSQGVFGQTMDTYNPDVRLFDAIMSNKIIYVALPTMGKSEAAMALGKMVVGDFRSAIARVQALPKDQRPRRPFLGFFDEAGSYVTQAWSRIFEQSRSARLVMLPAIQTKANFESISKELRSMVAGNTLTKFFFKPGEPETAEWMADMIGKEMQTQYSISASSSGSHKDAAFTERVSRGAVDSDTQANNVGYSESLKEDYRVTPSELTALAKGECVVVHDGNKVFHVRTPYVKFSPEFIESIGPFRINRPRPRFVRGLNLRDRLLGKDVA